MFSGPQPGYCSDWSLVLDSDSPGLLLSWGLMSIETSRSLIIRGGREGRIVYLWYSSQVYTSLQMQDCHHQNNRCPDGRELTYAKQLMFLEAFWGMKFQSGGWGEESVYKPQILSGFLGFISQIQRIDCIVCDLFQTDSFVWFVLLNRLAQTGTASLCFVLKNRLVLSETYSLILSVFKNRLTLFQTIKIIYKIIIDWLATSAPGFC